VKGTFFVLGWVAERWPGLVRDIKAGGHELGTHGHDHRRVTTLTPAQFREDLRRSKKLIEDASGAEVIGYRAPNYSIVRETLWAMDVLIEEGFRYDSSIFPIRHDRYGIPDFPRFPRRVRGSNGTALHEFPISTVRLAGMNLPFVGGGYLRHFPFGFVRWGMRRLNGGEQRPAIVYIHPWELDPDQPRQKAGWLTKIRHYRNLSATEGRLARLFTDYRFTTVREVLGL
ncbi:MAG TPA: XrtA system polysaccharide deacetylase, partial [Thermoanaerobaculia bacterium]|nr:XrtA system polysaccharide deacetylase [Thermoanaerobaculia bacterium]